MFNFLQQLTIGLALLPPYLIFLAIVLVILPTIAAALLRYSLHRHLVVLGTRVRRLLVGARNGQQPRIVENLEQRFQQASSNLEQVNTAALIEGTYSQEQFSFFGLSFRCEQIDYFCRVLPNLLLAFGLLGTFFGITINLSNLSQTITQVDINDVSSLVQELNQPLQGMGIAFITSLIAVACTSLLTVVNLCWNTSLAKSVLITSLEDYLDNIYLPKLQISSPLEQAVERLVSEFSGFLSRFGNTVQEAIEKSLGEHVKTIAEGNQKTSDFAEQVLSGLLASSTTIERSSTSFLKAAKTIEQSKFAEKLSSATEDLAIAQNQFSQSSLVLKKSTQSIESTLETLQISVQKLVEIGEEIRGVNQNYAKLIDLTQKQIVIEKTGLSEIKFELSNLAEKLRKV